MKLVYIICLLLLWCWVYAADGDSLEFSKVEFVTVDDETMRVFQEASCDSADRGSICHFPSNHVLFGSFTGPDRTEVIMLSGVPMDCPCTHEGELFGLINNKWQQLGPFEGSDFGNSYSITLGNECEKILSKSGNELLICEDDFAKSYDDFRVDPEFFPTYNLRLIDFSKPNAETILFSTRNMSQHSLFCTDLSPNEKFNLVDDVQISFGDFISDSYVDFFLSLRLTEISSSQFAISTNEDYGAMKLGGSIPTRHELVWLFDGQTFTPTPDTQSFLEQLQ